MQIDERVLERIVHLKDSQGMGFRRIANQLKKEGMANVSKSTIATIYNRFASKLRAETDGKLKHDKEWLSLVEVESRFAAKVEEAERKAEHHERVRKLAFQLASTSYGRAQIFSHPKALLEWCEVALENQTSPTLLDQLRKACGEDKIPFEKMLWETVGGPYYPQYYEAILKREGLSLDNFVREEVEYYLHGRERERTQKALQKAFSEILLNWRCSNCGSNILHTIMIKDRLSCFVCNTPFSLFCPVCGSKLSFEKEKDCYRCASCGRRFERVVRISERKYKELRGKLLSETFVNAS
jgi:DNA-directed RNA polymerase subunit RPC12/RpoP/transposase